MVGGIRSVIADALPGSVKSETQLPEKNGENIPIRVCLLICYLAPVQDLDVKSLASSEVGFYCSDLLGPSFIGGKEP